MLSKRCMVSVFALFVGLALTAPTANAQFSLGSNPNDTFGNPVNVGDTNLPGNIIVENTSTAGDPAVELQEAELQPSCGVNPGGGLPCGAGDEDLGVFTITTGPAAASGGAGSACAGVTFSVSGPAADGVYTFLPAVQVILDEDEVCEIEFNIALVNEVPDVDSNAGVAGVQTLQISRASGVSVSTGTPVGGLGSSETTVNYNCQVQIDKRYVTDGGATITDGALVFNNDDGTNLLSLEGDATPYTTEYVAHNQGNLPLSCVSRDIHITGGGATILGDMDHTIEPGLPLVIRSREGECSEFEGVDEYQLDCTCDAGADGIVVIPQKTDRAEVACVSCEVGIEKEVSCNGGPWGESCVSLVGEATQTRFTVTNLGDDPVTCDINDNVLGDIATGQTVIAGDPFSTIEDGVCSGEVQNTASLLNCMCGDVPAVLNPGQDSAEIDCCGVEVDKVISCLETAPGGGLTTGDADGLVSMNEDGTGACTGIEGSGLEFRYQAAPATGNSVDLNDCHFTDIQGNGGGVPIAEIPGLLGGDGFDVPGLIDIEAGVDEFCTEDFENAEGDGNTATIACACGDATRDGGPLVAMAHDTADFQCEQPDLDIRKECIENDDGTFTAELYATNTGGVAFLACEYSDVLRTKDGMDIECPAPDDALSTVFGDGVGFPSPGVGAGEQMVASLELGELSNDACNEYSVSCTVPGGGDPIVREVDVFCDAPGDGCFTRTPGYWGTHPETAQQVIDNAGGVINNCGLGITDGGAGGPDTEDGPFGYSQDICSVGNDKNALGTTPQQMQLVRQCAAASLNLAASAHAEFDCDEEFPNISATFNNCCNVVCAAGDADAEDINSCIGTLDAFNNFDADLGDSFDEVGLENSSADPSFCQDARNDGQANDSDEDDGRDYVESGKEPKCHPKKGC